MVKEFNSFMEKVSDYTSKAMSNGDITRMIYGLLKDNNRHVEISSDIENPVITVTEDTSGDAKVFISVESTLLSRYISVRGNRLNSLYEEDEELKHLVSTSREKAYAEYNIDLNLVKGPDNTVVVQVEELIGKVVEDHAKLKESAVELKDMHSMYKEGNKLGLDGTITESKLAYKCVEFTKENGKKFVLTANTNSVVLYIRGLEDELHPIHTESIKNNIKDGVLDEVNMFKAFEKCIEFLDTVIY